MENFNLAQLTAPAAIKNVTNDIPAPPQKSSEKGFSKVLNREESRADVADNTSHHANEKQSAQIADDRKADKARKDDKARETEDRVQSRSAKRSSKKEPLENSVDKTDAAPETGANVVAVPVEVPVEVIDESAESSRRAGVAEAAESEIPALFAEAAEAAPQTDPAVANLGLVAPEPVAPEDESGFLAEAAAAQNNLASQVVDGAEPTEESSGLPDGKESSGLTGTRPLPENPVENELTAKLSPAEITNGPGAEPVAAKPDVKLPAADSKNDFQDAAAEKKSLDLLQETKVKAGNPGIKTGNPEAKAEAGRVKAENTAAKPASTEIKAKKIEVKSESPKTTAVSQQDSATDPSASVTAANPVETGREAGARPQSLKVEGSPQADGVAPTEIPDDVEIRVESEAIASDEKLRQKRNLSDRLAAKQSVSGSQAGAVHLQGRARENQSSMLQNRSEQKNMAEFAEAKNRHSRIAFRDEVRQAASEKNSSESTLSSGVKDKPVVESNFSKSVLLPDMNSDLPDTAALKKGARSMSVKPLPISDDHLLNQIQAGLTRPLNGRQTVTIKLWPEHLGRVDIKLVMNKQHLTATFMVDHPEVKDAMMRKVESLRDSLGLHGIDAKDISVKVSPSAKSGNGPSLMNDGQQQNGNNSWRQFNQGNSNNSNNPGANRHWNDNFDNSLPAGAEINEAILPAVESLTNSGSLHISA